MADYYPVLKKTVAALPENTGAARREIYQRARKAIVTQLKGYDPPLSPSEITAEQLRLEESIRKVEAEAARETLGYSQPSAPAAGPAPTPAKPQDAAAPGPKDSGPKPPTAADRDTASAPARPAEPKAPTPAPRSEPAPLDTGASSAGETPAGPDTLKSAIDDARKLGTSAESASRSARSALEGQQGDPQKREPTIDTPKPEASAPAPASRRKSSSTGASPAGPGSGERPLPPIDGSMQGSRLPAIIGGVALLLLVVGIGAVGYSQRDTLSDLFSGDDGAATTASAPETPATAEQPEETEGSRKNAARLLDNGETAIAPDARSVTTTRITPTTPQTDPLAPAAPAPDETPAVRSVEPETPAETGEAGVAEAPQQGEPSAPAQETPAQETPAPATPTAESPSQSQTAAVAQRAFLYEEGVESGSAGQASSGQTIWSVGEESIDGRTETVLRMRIEVPERNIVANLSLRPNRDDTLPASHLLEVRFDLPQNFTGQGVAEVPGLVMKTTEEARGDALIGASVKVADGFFWVALSNIPDERERNLTLLQERGWIDLPMLYENRKRAILTLEKGTPGTRAVEQAVAAWRAE